MRFIEVGELPEKTIRYGTRNDLDNRLKEFMKMNIKIAVLDFNEREYSSSFSAYMSIRTGVSRHCYPIDVYHMAGGVYLVRRDI